MLSLPESAEVEVKSPLEPLVTEGARQMLQAALEQEIQDYLRACQSRRTLAGHAAVVRNGHLPARPVITGVGPLMIRQPRVRHREGGKFTSAILPKYLRRVPSIDSLIPALYLKGVSTGDFRACHEISVSSYLRLG